MTEINGLPAHVLLVHLVVVLIKPQTQPKQNVSNGKGTSQLAAHPHVCNITCILSPSPEVVTVEEPALPVADPSQVAHPPLFEEPAISGNKGIRMGGPTLGAWFLG